jgi:hypothetical protein
MISVCGQLVLRSGWESFSSGWHAAHRLILVLKSLPDATEHQAISTRLFIFYKATNGVAKFFHSQ